MLNKKYTALTLTALIVIFLLYCTQALALSINEEKKLAREFMSMIEKQNKIISDPMSQALITEIGERLIEKLPAQPFNFSFYIMDEEQFNAFAGPGANVFVNRGLITSLDTVDELAGILGHEIAHAVCRHVSQMVERSKLMNIGTLAGVLAGVIVGVGGGADVGQAVAIGSLAAGQTAMLAYSRENETEADQKGLVYIKEASFDPKGLLTGLEKIRARDWYGSESIPDYLKTHPGSKERIVYIQSWLDEHAAPDNNLPDKKIDPHRFNMVKSRLAGIYGNADETEKLFRQSISIDPENPALHYGMALVLARKSMVQDSLDHLRKALVKQVFDPYILAEMGRVYLMAGEPEKALEIMEGLDAIPQVEKQIIFYRAKASLMLNRPHQAAQGFEKIIESCSVMFPRAYYYMADIQDKSGKKELSHFYLGMYFYETKDNINARFHLEKSLNGDMDPDKKEKAKTLLASMTKKKMKDKK